MTRTPVWRRARERAARARGFTGTKSAPEAPGLPDGGTVVAVHLPVGGAKVLDASTPAPDRRRGERGAPRRLPRNRQLDVTRQMITAATGLAGSWWVYVALFLAVAASWAGVPAIGTAAAAAAGAGASQGRLNLAAVIVVVAVAGEVGGLLGYRIGFRWGRELLARPGKHQASRERTLAHGEQAYARWGRLAVFVTPAIVSGTAKMRYGQFAVWNFVASVGFALLTVAGAYGVGRLVSGHHAGEDIAILVVGAALGILLYYLARRYRARSGAHGPV